MVVTALNKLDTFSIGGEVYKMLNTFLNTQTVPSETLNTFEQRFPARVSKLNFCSDTTKLPDCILAFMLLSNSNIEDSHRISFLASASPSSRNFNFESTIDQLLSSVT